MVYLLPPLALAVAWLYVAGMNARAIREWRKSDDHWSERARILYPIREAAKANLWLLPINCTAAAYAFRTSDPAILTAIFLMALTGALLGTYRFDKELFPRFTFHGWLRSVIVGWVFSLSFIVGLIAVTLFMPATFGLGTALIGMGLLIYALAQQYGLWIWLLQKGRLLVAAPDRLVELVQRVSVQSGIKFQSVWMFESPVGYAAAFPMTGDLVFSEGMLFTQSDVEIEAICAHELAHLDEPRKTKMIRLVTSIRLLPIVFIRPVMQTFKLPGVLALALVFVLLMVLARKIGRKMEVRADDAARHFQLEPGVYASALEHLYQMNHMPAVMPQTRNVHPHLYDRMLAAGITPSYPRPDKPERISGHGDLMSVCLGVLVLAVLFKMFH
ncbi:MAG TPA: M48 family metalloprotease [Candidatus Sulfotelmatobacter sp.]|nr:M48 family metalloprotease [Candidatus Sulfotelmatobacter sp.]